MILNLELLRRSYFGRRWRETWRFLDASNKLDLFCLLSSGIINLIGCREIRRHLRSRIFTVINLLLSRAQTGCVGCNRGLSCNMRSFTTTALRRPRPRSLSTSKEFLSLLDGLLFLLDCLFLFLFQLQVRDPFSLHTNLLSSGGIRLPFSRCHGSSGGV